MKTQTVSTKTQQKVAEQVRAYLQRLGIDDDEVGSDGTIRLTASDRSRAGDDEPSPEIIDSMRAHARAIRALSPYAFVSTEHVDEWVHLSVLVKTVARKDKPKVDAHEITCGLKAKFPECISKHPKTRSVDVDMPFGFDGRITVRTLVEGPHGKRSINFGWKLSGDATEGWVLLVEWGEHKIKRPATFKKLTDGIVLKQLETLLARLKDPLDATGWTINVKTPDGFMMTGRHRQCFGLWQVLDRETDKMKAPVWADKRDLTILLINNFSGKEICPGVGQPVPEEVKPIEIVQ